MSRSFIKDFLILSSGTLINILISVFTTPIITRIVDPSAYGVYSLALTYGTICSTVAVLGLDQALMRFYYETEDANNRKSLLRFCFSVSMSLGLLFCLIAGIVILALNGAFGDGSVLFSVVFGFYVMSLIVNNFSSLVNRMQFKTKLLSLTTVLNKVFFFAFAMVCILTAIMEDSIALTFATGLAFLTVSLVRIVSDRHMWNFFKTNGKKAPKPAMMRYALPICLSSCVAVLLQGIDKIGLSFFATEHEIGIYASAFALVNIFSIVQSSFNTLWAPSSMEQYEKNPEDTDFFVRGCDTISLVMFALGLLIIMFKDVFILLLGPEYREAAPLVPFLIFFPIFYTISETTVSAVNLQKKTKYHVWVSVGSLAVAALSIVITVPALGIKGAALSMALAYATFFALRSHFGQKCMHIPFRFGKVTFASIVCFVYATYCTFAPGDVISALLGIIPLSFILFVYKDATISCMTFAKSKLKSIRKG